MTYHAKRTRGTAGGPLFLSFHGTGGTEDQFHGFAEQIRPGAHVTSPRGDVSEHGALRFFRRTGEGVYDMDDLAARTAALARFFAGGKSFLEFAKALGPGYSHRANNFPALAF